MMSFARRLSTSVAVSTALAVVSCVEAHAVAGPVPIGVAAAPPAAGSDLPAVADLNGDAFADLVVLTRRVPGVVLFFGGASGLPATPATRLALTRAPLDLALGDFDGDTVTDIAVLVRPGAVAVFLGNGASAGDGTFASPVMTLVPRAFTIAAAALHGPGAPHDLVAARAGRAGQLALLSSNGDGTFTATDLDLGTSVKGRPRLLVGDVGTSPSNNSRDGLDDVLIHVEEPRSNVTRAYLRFGDGVGGLVPALPVTTFLDVPGALALGDQTADGCNDLISTGRDNFGGGAIDAAIWTVTGRCNGDATGSFQTSASGTFRQAARIVDALTVALDGSPEEEIVVVDDRAGQLGIQPMSAGSYLVRQDCSVGELPVAVAAGDFDDDGAIDLATANRRSGDVTVLAGPTVASCGSSSTLQP
jgi:hypothetical protein